MQKEQITDKEAIFVVTIFIMGSTLIIGIGGAAKNDAWLAGIAGMIFAVPVLLLYSRLSSLFPGKDLYEILDRVLGVYLGKLVSLLYLWYAFHLGAMILRNFGEFVNTVTMPETPIFVPMLFVGLVCIAAVKLGIEVIGRTCSYMLPAVIILVALVQALAIPTLHFNYIKPILGEGISPVLKGGFSAFAFPFAETVLFLGVASAFKTPKAPYKVYFTGLFFAGSIIVILTMRNIMILGEMAGNLYFPSHVAVSRISIGDFLQRIEVTVAFVFIVGVFIKASICLLVACRGIAHLLNLPDYRTIVLQTGLLMIYFSQTVYGNIMDMRFWAFNIYRYYAFPFQVIIPLLLWIASEIVCYRSRSRKDSLSQ